MQSGLERSMIDLTNNYERAVFLAGDVVFPRERTRYEWVAKQITGKSVLEIGCSSGYGTQFLPETVERYYGLDYDSQIIEVASCEFGRQGVSFIVADINRFLTDYPDCFYDTIIAFEVIEHLDNGLDVIARLKKHCHTLLVTCPYAETSGFWGDHHRLHGLTANHFSGFKIQYISEDGRIIPEPERADGGNLMLMKWSDTSVLCSISTRGRYDSTLPMAIQAVIMQTRLPDKLIIFDDNDVDKRIDLREMPHYKHLFQMLQMKGISWEVYYPDEPKGQHFNHQRANLTGYSWVWRIDDDCVPNPDVLECLMAQTAKGVGAVGGSVIIPGQEQSDVVATGRIDRLDDEPNIQWNRIVDVQQVDHLHCSFLYRAGVVDYNLALSRVAHREETDFTWKLRCAGYQVLVTPCVTWHLKNPAGGIRDGVDQMYKHDESVFNETLRLLATDLGQIVILDNGIGDHIVARSVVDELPGKVTVACCYPDVFEGLPTISIEQARMLVDVDQWNIYRKMVDWQWGGSLADAYRRLYVG
jgi:SAM-dependent methyltransferase